MEKIKIIDIYLKCLYIVIFYMLRCNKNKV